MRLLDRYLLRELLTPFGFCLGGFLVFWMTFDLFNHLSDFQKALLTPLEVGRYYLVGAPEIMIEILPVALLLAMLYALTTHARHHEITAIRSAGVSLWRLCLPYFAVGLLLSLISFALNELWVPDSVEAAERILVNHQTGTGLRSGPGKRLDFTNEAEGRTWGIGVYNKITGEMANVQVLWRTEKGTFRLNASRGAYTNGVWTFFEVQELRYPLEQGMPLVPVLQTNVLALPEFRETPEEIRSEIKINRVVAPGARRTRSSDMSITEILDYQRLHPRLTREARAILGTKLEGRLATPWTCLVVVLIAIPFGAPSGRRNVFVGVASSILIGFAYFVLQQVCLALGSGGYVVPWVAAWGPNLGFGLTGIWLTGRVR